MVTPARASPGPRMTPSSFLPWNGTTARIPMQPRPASASPTAYTNVRKSGSGRATSTSINPLVLNNDCAATRSAATNAKLLPNANPEPWRGRKGNAAADDRCANERIISEQGGAVEIRVIEEWREVRGPRDAKARFDHASRHAEHPVRAGRGDHPPPLAQPPALRAPH